MGIVKLRRHLFIFPVAMVDTEVGSDILFVDAGAISEIPEDDWGKPSLRLNASIGRLSQHRTLDPSPVPALQDQ